MEAAIQGVLVKLDAYSDYIPPEELDQFRTGVENEFGGIGIRVGLIDGKLMVITPLMSTPAYRAGILAGDQILKIGDASTKGMPLEEAIRRMKGKVDTQLELTVRHRHDGRVQTCRSTGKTSASKPCSATGEPAATAGTIIATPSTDRLYPHHLIQPPDA